MNSFRKVFSVVVCSSIIATSIITSNVFAAQTLIDAGFESGLDGFSARASETVERTSAEAYEGSYSIATSGRTEAWNGPVTALGTGWVSGETYSSPVQSSRTAAAPLSCRCLSSMTTPPVPPAMHRS